MPHVVHPPTAPEGVALLATQCLSIDDLATALHFFLAETKLRAAKPLGVGEAGFFGECQDGVFLVPWIQIHEILGNVPAGTTDNFMTSGGTLQ